MKAIARWLSDSLAIRLDPITRCFVVPEPILGIASVRAFVLGFSDANARWVMALLSGDRRQWQREKYAEPCGRKPEHQGIPPDLQPLQGAGDTYAGYPLSYGTGFPDPVVRFTARANFAKAFAHRR
jgi:hypothetical protein